MAAEAKEHDVVRAVGLQLVWKILSVEGGYHVKPGVVLVFAADHTLVFSVCHIEAIIVDLLIRLHFASAVWFEVESYRERL